MCICKEEKVVNDLNSTNIDYINIYGLFGRYDIEVPFEKQVNIYIGENGLGKTTILNCIYFLLKGNYSKLKRVKFSSIHVKFKKEAKEYKISFDDVWAYEIEKNYHRYYDDKTIGDQWSLLVDDVDLHSSEMLYYTIDEKRRHQIDKWNSNIINEYHVHRENGKSDNVVELKKAIKDNVVDRIVYLPTYRRIEDDFELFNYNKKKFNEEESLIKFGMDDVQKSIDIVLDQIKDLAVQGFNKITGVLLKQYVDETNSEEIKNNVSRLTQDKDTVKIVLDRIGKEIEIESKTKIIDLIDTGDIENNKYFYLQNFIIKLIESYDKQKKYDDRIKKFVDTCNKYLNDKQFHYNQSALNLNIYLDGVVKDENLIELMQLSSGEKQIVSLFSKLYFESDKKSIVIIDEPELSLSIKWQKMLLPDIIRSENCNLLLTVTHSPFIFENEFDYDTKEMRKQISKGQ